MISIGIQLEEFHTFGVELSNICVLDVGVLIRILSLKVLDVGV